MTASVLDDPFAETVDENDPFATADDVMGGGGVFTPTPSLEALEGRIVIMVPRKFEDDAPIPEGFRQAGGPTVRDRYTVDMIVVSGGPLTYWYNAKVEGSEERELAEFTVEELPAIFTNVWRVEASIIGQLRRIDGKARPVLMGTVRRGPQAKDRGKKDFDSIAAEMKAWEGRGRKGAAPKFSWQIDVEVTPEERALAIEAWKNAGLTL